MADKAISELVAANQVTPTDLFVLEQSGTAKKLTGQTLENWLISIVKGLGESVIKIAYADLDNAVAPGWYYWDEQSTIDGISANNWCMHVIPYNTGSSFSVQKIYPISSTIGFYEMVRRKQGGVWQPVEHSNPLMMPGVEYATTEKHEGKTVYRKRLWILTNGKIGNNSGVETQTFSHSTPNFNKLVRCTGFVDDYLMPYMATNGGMTAVCGVTSASIVVRIHNTEWESRAWNFDIAYTKTT